MAVGLFAPLELVAKVGQREMRVARFLERQRRFEIALRLAPQALIHAHASDPFGNLLYAGSARNFNPLMAMAAGTVIVETENLLPLGGIAAEAVHTPGPFVDHVVHLHELTGEYAVVRR